ncbi:lysine N(6)-hydroxylase/L-ornithine N(5)-oxygenase family protein [Kordia sp.]|uniref:lysine N(6)-hydroxylase/L-ornithine N(5)-oxygenase family protein n=1 Tax=Kordia sp. TaxID=1965332 RepID=UPI003D2E61FE
MKTHDIIGIGIGPSNLSTAALLYPHKKDLNYLFFDNKEEFRWHPGMMFPDVTIQVSILKDLVSMVDPTSPFSFLNFLKKTGRLYMFAAKGNFDNVKRKEFEQYFKWCADSMEELLFSSTVEEVTYEDDLFQITVNDKKYQSKNLLIGAGLTAKTPKCCKPYLGEKVFHNTQFLTTSVDYSGQQITVVGGGQSGAEVVLHLLNDKNVAPENIHWCSSSYNLLPMENTPFSNELYSPNYSEYFFDLQKELKGELLNLQKYTSDGISETTLNQIYELLYNNKFLLQKADINMYMNTRLNGMQKNSDGNFDLQLNQKDDNNRTIHLKSDIVVLATGLEYKLPKFLYPIMDKLITTNGKFDTNEDYSIKTNESLKGGIYLHNGSRHVRGVADPNLSLLAWRSAKIINSIAKNNFYDTLVDESLINWNLSKLKNKKHEITI